MKFKATAENLEMFVEITNLPSLTFEEIEVMRSDGHGTAFIQGPATWNLLETTTENLDPFYGLFFDLENDEWYIHQCIICKDTSKIYFRHARQKVTG